MFDPTIFALISAFIAAILALYTLYLEWQVYELSARRARLESENVTLKRQLRAFQAEADVLEAYENDCR